jgi:hypothetical protein
MLTNAWSGCTSFASIYRAFGGGKHGSPAKQYLVTSASNSSKPVASSLLDYYKSLVIHYLNFLYMGLVFSSLPKVRVSLSHHVIVDTPNKSGSIPVLTFWMKVVTYLGCS